MVILHVTCNTVTCTVTNTCTYTVTGACRVTCTYIQQHKKVWFKFNHFKTSRGKL